MKATLIDGEPGKVSTLYLEAENHEESAKLADFCRRLSPHWVQAQLFCQKNAMLEIPMNPYYPH